VKYAGRLRVYNLRGRILRQNSLHANYTDVFLNVLNPYRATGSVHLAPSCKEKEIDTCI